MIKTHDQDAELEDVRNAQRVHLNNPDTTIRSFSGYVIINYALAATMAAGRARTTLGVALYRQKKYPTTAPRSRARTGNPYHGHVTRTRIYYGIRLIKARLVSLRAPSALRRTPELLAGSRVHR